eukprot:TRINITY_DN40340_c0_g1_i1.p1 TRINITY_DN40340_c0_g1~~TRINITY_DN40340_c0_g1_i1.p1  ORF type:complete len:505 (+),score=80.14 TRINITY_DN40340_c0_g1_i1:119-1516(+)
MLAGGAQGAQQMAARLGITDLGEWATKSAIAIGSKAHQEAKQLVVQKMKAEYGDEIADMLGALSDCTEKLKEELRLSQAKFGISLALPLVAVHHNTLPAPESQGLVTDLALVRDGCHWVDFAMGAYGSPSIKDPSLAKASIGVACGEKPGVEILLGSLPAAGVACPGHFVALDRNQRTVVLGVRGTSTLSDAITDAVGESTQVPECGNLKAHKAMLVSARAVLDKTRQTLNDTLNANSGFTLVVTGHSLGAGTAILCSILLTANQLSARPRIRCFAYAPPPVVSPLNAAAVKAVEIHSFINRVDVVPRASLANVFHLGEECMAIDQLPLDFLYRFRLMRRDPVPEDAAEQEAKQKIIDAVSSIRESRKRMANERFPPLYVPGEVYWIEWKDQPGGVQDSPRAAESEALVSKPRLHKVDAESFQALNLRGGTNALKDHLCGGYKDGLEGYKAHLEANGGCQFCNCQ